jgi:hypothetical protein
MNPKLTETNIKVIFYGKSNRKDWKAWVYRFISRQDMTHTVVWFTQSDREYVYVINTKGGMYLVEKSKYEWILKRQGMVIEETVVDLGSAPVSLYQLSSFLDRPEFRLSNTFENSFWWLVGRFISKTYTPMSCSLATSYLLRMCGFKVDLHIAPHLLHKELRDGVDNHFWTSKGWQEHTS